ncbi:MAG TPA: hypothetical protein PLI57_03070 [Spirochaetota bacterium]|nr:hypothetical protein [Spirochaetota bacterium]
MGNDAYVSIYSSGSGEAHMQLICVNLKGTSQPSRICVKLFSSSKKPDGM